MPVLLHTHVCTHMYTHTYTHTTHTHTHTTHTHTHTQDDVIINAVVPGNSRQRQRQSESDEAYARELQERFDREASTPVPILFNPVTEQLTLLQSILHVHVCACSLMYMYMVYNL